LLKLTVDAVVGTVEPMLDSNVVLVELRRGDDYRCSDTPRHVTQSLPRQRPSLRH
jgi:hypothetical protein